MKAKLIPAIALTLLSLLSFTACSDDEEIEYNDGKTRYTVIGDVPSVAANLISSATVYEYNASDTRIDSNRISNPSSGTRYVYEANDSTTHLKVKLISKAGTYRWGDTIVMIRPGKNVTIKISIKSPTAMNEPRL